MRGREDIFCRHFTNLGRPPPGFLSQLCSFILKKKSFSRSRTCAGKRVEGDFRISNPIDGLMCVPPIQKKSLHARNEDLEKTRRDKFKWTFFRRGSNGKKTFLQFWV